MSSKMTPVAPLLLLLISTLSPGTAVCQEPVPLSPRYDRGLTLASSDGDLEIRFQGRLHLHWTAWNNDSAMEDSGKAAQDGFYFRRARIKVSYDLEKQANFRSAGRPLGWYYATDEVGYRMQIQGGCLKSLNITVKVFPVIQLRGIYKKKTKKCARKSILEHERRHSAVAKREFKKLANDIKKIAIRLFPDKSAPYVNTVAAALNGELD